MHEAFSCNEVLRAAMRYSAVLSAEAINLAVMTKLNIHHLIYSKRGAQLSNVQQKGSTTKHINI